MPLPTFDGPFAALTDSDYTMPIPHDPYQPAQPGSAPCVWNALTPTSLPEIGQPVLLRLKDRKEITRPQNAALGAEDVGRLFRPGFRYGYTIAVIRCGKDGFGHLFPLEFVAYEFKQGGEFDLRTRYTLDTVEAWMVLS